MSRDIMKQYDAKVTASVDGEDLGVFDSHTPPEIGSETGTYRPGGAREAIATRGLRSVGTTTVAKAISGREEYERYKRIQARAGRAEMTVTEQPLDANGDPYGQATIYTGILNQVVISEYSSEGTDNRTVTLTMQPNGEIG